MSLDARDSFAQIRGRHLLFSSVVRLKVISTIQLPLPSARFGL
jgi:hypothetical protein